MKPDGRWLVLTAGALIAGVCVYRIQSNQPYDYEPQLQAAVSRGPAPLFEGVDEQNQIFRLASYLGRHRVIVAFYDGKAGADRSQMMIGLRDRADELARLDVKTVAVSQAIPQENRAALKNMGEFPGPLISDVDGSIHQKWGCLSADGAPRTGLFLIDRKGTVAYYAGVPRSAVDLEECWKELQ